MSCDLRHDKLSRKTRKDHNCEWCHQTIEKGSMMVRVSGFTDGQAWMGKFHPECWRAEHLWWRKNEHEDSWPGERMMRGRTDVSERPGKDLEPEFTNRRITQDELDYRYKYAASWLVVDQAKLCPHCFGIPQHPDIKGCLGCLSCDFTGTIEGFQLMQKIEHEAVMEGGE